MKTGNLITQYMKFDKIQESSLMSIIVYSNRHKQYIGHQLHYHKSNLDLENQCYRLSESDRMDLYLTTGIDMRTISLDYCVFLKSTSRDFWNTIKVKVNHFNRHKNFMPRHKIEVENFV